MMRKSLLAVALAIARGRHECRMIWLGLERGRCSLVSPASMAPAWRIGVAMCVAASALSMVVRTTPSYGDTGHAVATVDPVAADPPRAPINAESFSCKELKDTLQSAGTLTILSGERGWGDTYYGPRVPRCQFWQRPVFSFVNTTDGPCGVGYICVEKLGSGGGG